MFSVVVGLVVGDHLPVIDYWVFAINNLPTVSVIADQDGRDGCYSSQNGNRGITFVKLKIIHRRGYQEAQRE